MMDDGNGFERVFSVLGTLNAVLLKDGALHLIVGEWTRPLHGDIDIHPSDIQKYIYREGTPEVPHCQWELTECPISNFDITDRPDNLPGYHVQHRVSSSQ
jgi:hypothetical protein